jgi:hypothetical protein
VEPEWVETKARMSPAATVVAPVDGRERECLLIEGDAVDAGGERERADDGRARAGLPLLTIVSVRVSVLAPVTAASGV